MHHLVPESTAAHLGIAQRLAPCRIFFALESFIDELAERAKQDPVRFSSGAPIRHPRARRVIEARTTMANWSGEGETHANRGQAHRAKGIGLAQYKNRAAYAAVIVEVEVEDRSRLVHAWCAADAGLVVNPDAVVNQLEGGIVQSRELGAQGASPVRQCERRARRLGGLSSAPKTSARSPRSKSNSSPSDSDTPLGVGEATAGPTAAAIGGIVTRFHARYGVRMIAICR